VSGARLHRAEGPVPADLRGAVAAIGNFDGVHRGHLALVDTARDLAAEIGAPHGVVLFDPHPRRFFQPDTPAFLLTDIETRAELLGEAGVTRIFVLPFDRDLANEDPRAFVFDTLRARLGLAGAAAGEEFQFGKGRAGNAESLAVLAAEAGLAARIAPPAAAAEGEEKYSSSEAREALRDGDPKAAAAVLGRPWRVRGVVREGDRRGRTIGFPTASLLLGELIEPKYGVYAVRAATDDGKTFDAVANFGLRPTVEGKEPRLEVYLFEFSGDLYGRELKVDFIDFLRGEQRFDGLDALKAQIDRDCEAARAALA